MNESNDRVYSFCYTNWISFVTQFYDISVSHSNRLIIKSRSF